MLHLSWFPLVLIYILTNSISKILQKRIMDKKCMDPSAFSSIFQFNAGIFTIPFIFMEPLKLAGSIHVWLVVGLSCLCFTFCMVFYYYGLKRMEMSQAETIATTRSIWMMFFAQSNVVDKGVGTDHEEMFLQKVDVTAGTVVA